MKIYTKGGDTGQTSLFGGSRISKHHLRIESYGTTDELNSFIGLLRDHIDPELKAVHALLHSVQEIIFNIGSHLAADPTKENLWLPDIYESDINTLEEAIDLMQDQLPELKNFILPGGHPTVSYCHVCRTICRRAERNISALNETEPINPLIIAYLNRLSDYFFILSRFIGKSLAIEEIIWQPRTK